MQYRSGSLVEEIERDWKTDPRWRGILRPYSAADVARLSGTVRVRHTLAELGARMLWNLFDDEDLGYVHALGALSGGQAVQMVQAGLRAIYASGWQVAADANTAGQTYPDQSLYPVDSVPTLVRRINNAFAREDQKSTASGAEWVEWNKWYAPIVADAEAGFGGNLNAFELMKAMIEAGAAAVHYEDQLSSAKKCGHLGGKVLIPTGEAINKLVAARLAADVMGVPTVLIARTDANSATIIANDIDERDKPFVEYEKGRTSEGFYYIRGGLDAAIARGLAYAPYADLLWCETSKPDMNEAKRFADAIHAQYPGKYLAYNCSPSFNWAKHLSADDIARFQRELAAMGYKFQFVTLAGFHSVNHAMFDLAHGYAERGMSAYVELQQNEFAAADEGYTAVRHQEAVGTGYFDEVAKVISGESSTLAMKDSTEKDQFHK